MRLTHSCLPFRSLREIPRPHTSHAGGKAGTLARLIQAGALVPEGFVIPPEAFENDAVSTDCLRALEEAVNRLAGAAAGRARFAVRSSAAAEDAESASFAGEFESLLDVPADGLADAAARVWRSGSSDRVRSYSDARGLDWEHRMYVLVQCMVPAEVSGVLFTADPHTGSRAAMIGNAVAGLGNKLVSGEADPLVFRLVRPHGRLESDGAVPDVLASAMADLCRLAMWIEREFRKPQDIEWAISGGKVYVLQTRPITSLSPEDPLTGVRNDSRLGEYLWTSTNFGEALPEVMTPLTWSLMSLYLDANRLGVENDGFPLGGNIGGRFYMNLSLPASLFSALGFGGRRLRAALSEMFGELPDSVEIPLIPNTRLRAIREFLPHAVHRARLIGGLKREIPGFVADGPMIAAEVKTSIAGCGSPQELRALWRSRLEPLLRRTMLMLAAGTSDYKNLTRRFRPKLAALVGEADANALLSGRPGAPALASLGPLIGLSKLASGEMSAEEYVEAYGHRGPNEFELSVPTPAEDPGWFDAQREAARSADRTVEALLAEKARGYQAAWVRFVQHGRSTAQRWDRRIAAIHTAALTREAVRSEVVRLLRLTRTYALRAAELAGLNGDVFFLELEEIDRLLDGDRQALDRVPGRRSAYERLAALPPYPPLILGRFDPHAWAADPDRPIDFFQAGAERVAADEGAAAGAIRGFSGSPGVVEGVVRVLASTDEAAAFRTGEILVARTTNIGWTPLFPRAAAIVTDVGAPLSHAAIVARELGIPAVVGAKTATSRLATGDRVRVDGAGGIVTIL